MKEENLRSFINAAKWSAFTQIAAKMVTPITTMILARMITPEAFGVVATVTMIVSFADMFTDAGFHKYLIQHEYTNQEEKLRNANVAFWTNFGISAFLWLIISICREQIAVLVGNPGLGNVIAIACSQLLLTSFSSIQMALYKRNFDFKTLFWVRVVSVLIPFVVTIPMAFLGLSYWALVIGSIMMRFINAIILTVKSEWRPRWCYNFVILKEMLSFSIWSLLEAITIWLTSWADVFVISYFLNEHLLGIYKTSTTLVNALMSLITASIVPVLFSALSRLQDDPGQFNKLFFATQRLVSIFVFPLGIGVFLYSDLATAILLGSQWTEASGVIGLWSLTSAIVIVFGYFSSEVYRAKGRPKLSVLAQTLHLIVLIPVCIISSKYGFWPLVYARSLVRLEFIIVHMIIMKSVIEIPVERTVKNIVPTISAAILMGVMVYLLQQISHSIGWSICSIIICALLYIAFLSLFPSMRKDIVQIFNNLRSKF